MKTIYQTKDGETFPTQVLAQDHEKALFTAWLETDEAETYRTLYKGLSGQGPLEYCGTEQSLLINLLSVFWNKLP